MSVKIDQIIRSDRKNLEVQISVEGYIIVRAPIEETMESIQDFLDSKKKSVNIKSLAIVNNRLLLFLSNSYLVKFSTVGKIENINKLSSKLNSFPIFINESIIYLNDKNKLVITN